MFHLVENPKDRFSCAGAYDLDGFILLLCKILTDVPLA